MNPASRFLRPAAATASTAAAIALAFAAAPCPQASAQRGLQVIPDTNPQAQIDSFTVDDALEVNLFARDPDIAKPIHMNFDGRGRLFVVSSTTYPHIVPGDAEGDKVIVLEDADGDGVAEKRTVFADGLYIPTAVLPYADGAFVANATEILFLRDKDGDGMAEERQTVLSGFGTEDTHHIIHTFHWGPEGMMYMNQSIYIHSHIETPYGVRRLLGGGVWHFRPETRELEVYCKGFVNPWGMSLTSGGRALPPTAPTTTA
ncbi:MAG: hypothetical protein R3F11_18395 [Verrucomicrobiales bacterium]